MDRRLATSGSRYVKTYYCTSDFHSEFPPEFVSAIGEKYIEVRLCWATVNNTLVGDLMLHADFIKRDAYLDHFVNIVNVINGGASPDKYAYPECSSKDFNVWFTDLKGNRVDVDAFVLKLLLVYES